MGKVIAVSNHKGGVGKTTTVVNLGASLSRLGKKILLVDLDPQANLSLHLGISSEENNIYTALRGDTKLEPIKVLKDFYLIPSDIDLTASELELSNQKDNKHILKAILEPFKAKFDYIIIDTPPNLGLLTINALCSSEEVLIPLQPHILALKGLARINSVIEQIQLNLNKNLARAGIVITQYDSRKVIHRDIVETIEKNSQGYVFKTKIRENVALIEATGMEVDIHRYQPKSYGSEDYNNLAIELLERGV
jgi:chromosome partitioning protein